MKHLLTCSLFCLAAHSLLQAQTATYTNSSQMVTLTGIGGGKSHLDWGKCAFDGTNTNCTVSAPYTGVGGPGTIAIVFTYPGNGSSPFTANSVSPGSDTVTLGLLAGSSGSIAVSLTESTGATVKFLSTAFTFFFDFSATCSGTAVSPCSVGPVGLTAGGAISGVVHGTFDATPSIRTVISASAYGGFSSLAPATWMEIYGANLANVASQTWASTDFNGNAAPTGLGGTTVTIGGQAAFIDYVSPTQVNAQVPSTVAPGSQRVVVTTPGGTSAAFNITVNATEPGLLAPAVFNISGNQYVVALLPDNITFILPAGVNAGVPTARAKPGDTIILYGVGFGPVTPVIVAGQIVSQSNQLSGTVQVLFNGTPGTVTFAGLVGGYLGLYQFNVVVPKVDSGDSVPLSFTLNGSPGPQKMVIAIGN